MMFIIGTGIEYWPEVPFRSAMCSYSATPFSVAAAFATARETARIAFAPRFSLFSVPSKSIMALSISLCATGSIPSRAGAIFSFTAATALVTPLPM